MMLGSLLELTMIGTTNPNLGSVVPVFDLGVIVPLSMDRAGSFDPSILTHRLLHALSRVSTLLTALPVQVLGRNLCELPMLGATNSNRGSGIYVYDRGILVSIPMTAFGSGNEIIRGQESRHEAYLCRDYP
jgi:hypothetical protein